ncbi:hypothetical protein RCL1_003680 [Eukaryota sp. TZLM3-RCL]
MILIQNRFPSLSSMTLTKQQKSLYITLLIDVVLGMTFYFSSWYWYSLVEPVKRDFSILDPSISHKMQPNILTWNMLQVLCYSINGVVIGALSATNPFALASFVSTFVFGNGLSQLVSSVVKTSTGRLRPDFLDRCKPDVNLVCQGDYKTILDGRMSFPSGHGTLSGMSGIFLALALYSYLKPYKSTFLRSLRIIPIVIVIVLTVISGITRTVDRHHHPSDVAAGLILGGCIAAYCFWLHTEYQKLYRAHQKEETPLLKSPESDV